MPKKICHLVITFGNKNQTYTKELLELLNSNSNDNHYVFSHYVFTTSDKIQIVKTRQHNYVKFLFLFIKYYIFDSEFRALKKYLSIKEFYKWMGLFENLPDILHIHHVHAISIPILKYLKHKNIKLVFSLRGRDLLVNTLDIHELEKLKAKLDLAHKIHNISYYMRWYLKDKLSIDSEVIYRGQPFAEASNIKINQVKSDQITAIAVGRLKWEKGHVYLIETICGLRKNGFNIKLDIYGDGNLEEYLNFRIRQLGMEEHIKLRGHIDNSILIKKYKHYNLAIQPSLTEALSNGLIDFMMHDLPCVITNIGGMPEVITHNHNGIIIEKDNFNALGDAIINVIDLDFESLKSFNRIHRDKFTRISEITGFYQLYDTLLKNNS